jgi:probable phosphoglycerate mutase
MELLLIRHGLPLHVEKQDGSPADPPLSDIGRMQARRVAEWLSREKIDRLYTSPMARAVQTAEPLSQQFGIVAEHREGVAEYDRNASEYIPVEKLKEIDYERWKRLMYGDIDADFHRFAHTAIESVEDIVRDNPGRRVAVTCHGGVINVWAAHVLGMAPRMFFNPDYTSIHRFMCASSGERTIRVLNEAVHLRTTVPIPGRS